MLSVKSDDAGLAAGLQMETVRVFFTGAASGANGVILAPRPAQAALANKVFLSMGGSSDAASAKMTTAIAQKLVRTEGLTNAILPPNNTLAAERETMVTGLVAYMASMEKNDTDGNAAYAWAIQGIDIKDIVAVRINQVTLSTGAISAFAEAFDISAPVVLAPGITLGANSRPIKTGSTQIVMKTDNIIIVPHMRLAFGCLQIADGATFTAPAAGQLICLELDIMV